MIPNENIPWTGSRGRDVSRMHDFITFHLRCPRVKIFPQTTVESSETYERENGMDCTSGPRPKCYGRSESSTPSLHHPDERVYF